MRQYKNLPQKEKAGVVLSFLLMPFVLLFTALGKKFRFFSTRKRQLIASALCAATVISCLPALSISAFAATNLPSMVLVRDIGNMVKGKAVTYYAPSQGGVVTDEPDGWTLRYDPSNGVLTMRNFIGSQTAVRSLGDLTVRLEGANRIERYRHTSDDSMIRYAFYSEGSLTFTGDGSLSVTPNYDNYKSSAIYITANLLFGGNSTVRLESKNAPAIGSRSLYDPTVRVEAGATLSLFNSADGGNLTDYEPACDASHRVYCCKKARESELSENFDEENFSQYSAVMYLASGTEFVTDLQQLKTAVANQSVNRILVGDRIDFPSAISINRPVKIYSAEYRGIGSERGYTGSLFRITGGGKLTLQNFYYSGGRYAQSKPVNTEPVFDVRNGELELIGCSVSNVLSTANGAAVAVGSSGILTLSGRTTIVENETTGKAAAVYSNGKIRLSGLVKMSVYPSKEIGCTVYLANNIPIEVAGDIDPQSSIPVTPATRVTRDLPVVIVRYCPKDYSACFLREATGDGKPVWDIATEQIQLQVTHVHCICGNHQSVGDHTTEETQNFDAWVDPHSLPNQSGSYYLDTDVTVESNYVLAVTRLEKQNINLCLNGHTIYGKDKNAIYDSSVSSVLNICDCNGGGVLTHANGGEGEALYISTGGSINLFGGKIKGNRNEDIDGGGAVCVHSTGDFRMYGGTIQDNTSTHNGGGISALDNGAVTLYGGTISGNRASAEGGGVSVENGRYGSNRKVYLKILGDVTITGNIAGDRGGGVYLASKAELAGGFDITGNYLSSGYTDNFHLGNFASRMIAVTGDLSGKPIQLALSNDQLSDYEHWYEIAVGSTTHTLTRDDLAYFIPKKSGLVANFRVIRDVEVIGFELARKTLKTSDFTVSAPNDPVYGSGSYRVTVTPKMSDCGTVTIRYKRVDGKEPYWVTGEPRDVGTYEVYLTAGGGSTPYNEAVDLHDDSWTFTVNPKTVTADALSAEQQEQALYTGNPVKPVLRVRVDGRTLTEGKDYEITPDPSLVIGRCTATLTFRGNYSGTVRVPYTVEFGEATDEMIRYPEPNAAGWYAKNFSIEAADGYEISEDQNTYGASVSVNTQSENGKKIYYVRDTETGAVYRGEFLYKLDCAAPGLVRVSYNDSPFQSVLRKLTFGLFFRDSVTVKAQAEDKYSGVAKIEYYAAEGELDSYPPKKGDWKESLRISAPGKKVIYIRVTDVAGNSVVTNDQGIVIYTNSEMIPVSSMVYDKKDGAGKDVDFTLTLNGNTLDSVYYGERALTAGADYRLDGTTLRISKEYLQTFDAGTEVPLKVTFSALGVGVQPDLDQRVAISIVDTTHTHTPVHHAAKKATCTEDGNREYWSCENCDEIFADAACRQQLATAVEEKLNHRDAGRIEAKDPTCEEAGNRAYWSCPDCGKFFADENGKLDPEREKAEKTAFDIAPNGHHFTEKDGSHPAGKADCEHPATYYYTCRDCQKAGKETYESGNPLGHDFTLRLESKEYEKKAADCQQNGEYWMACSRCKKAGTKEFFTGEKRGPHHFDSYVSDNNATDTQDGTKTAKCSVPGCSEKNTITDEGSRLTDPENAQPATGDSRTAWPMAVGGVTLLAAAGMLILRKKRRIH